MTVPERPDWATGREYCPTCRNWKHLTKEGRLRKHKRQEPGRWHMVPCEGSGAAPAAETELSLDNAASAP